MTFQTTEVNLSLLQPLVGNALETTVATNSLKLRFNVDTDQRGSPYVWIDPPWELYSADSLIADSGEYRIENEEEFFEKCAPLNGQRILESVKYQGGVLSLVLGEGLHLVLPQSIEPVDSEGWYHHWYVSDVT